MKPKTAEDRVSVVCQEDGMRNIYVDGRFVVAAFPQREVEVVAEIRRMLNTTVEMCCEAVQGVKHNARHKKVDECEDAIRRELEVPK